MVAPSAPQPYASQPEVSGSPWIVPVSGESNASPFFVSTAIHLPSGDHAGRDSVSIDAVSCVGPEVAPTRTFISPKVPAEYVNQLPSGDQVGAFSYRLSVVMRVARP